MPSPIDSMCHKVAIASAVFLALPCALAQQGTGPALPPPSLYDEAPPTPAKVTPAPMPPSAPAEPMPAPQPAAAPVENRPQPAAVPVEQPRPAAAPVESAPVAATSQPMEEEAQEEPWYRRLWPFGAQQQDRACGDR